MSLNIIVAMTEERVIGDKGKIPWHIKEDLKLFRDLTIGNTVLMGRKTYDSLDEKYKPLPDRNNVVITRNIKENLDLRVTFYYDLNDGIRIAKSYGKPVFIAGGASIYRQTLPLVSRLYISHIKYNIQGDVFFPDVNLNGLKVIEEKDFEKFIFRVYERIS